MSNIWQGLIDNEPEATESFRAWVDSELAQERLPLVLFEHSESADLSNRDLAKANRSQVQDILRGRWKTKSNYEGSILIEYEDGIHAHIPVLGHKSYVFDEYTVEQKKTKVGHLIGETIRWLLRDDDQLMDEFRANYLDLWILEDDDPRRSEYTDWLRSVCKVRFVSVFDKLEPESHISKVYHLAPDESFPVFVATPPMWRYYPIRATEDLNPTNKLFTFLLNVLVKDLGFMSPQTMDEVQSEDEVMEVFSSYAMLRADRIIVNSSLDKLAGPDAPVLLLMGKGNRESPLVLEMPCRAISVPVPILESLFELERHLKRVLPEFFSFMCVGGSRKLDGLVAFMWVTNGDRTDVLYCPIDITNPDRLEADDWMLVEREVAYHPPWVLLAQKIIAGTKVS